MKRNDEGAQVKSSIMMTTKSLTGSEWCGVAVADRMKSMAILIVSSLFHDNNYADGRCDILTECKVARPSWDRELLIIRKLLESRWYCMALLTVRKMIVILLGKKRTRIEREQLKYYRITIMNSPAFRKHVRIIWPRICVSWWLMKSNFWRVKSSPDSESRPRMPMRNDILSKYTRREAWQNCRQCLFSEAEYIAGWLTDNQGSMLLGVECHHLIIVDFYQEIWSASFLQQFLHVILWKLYLYY